MEALYNINFPVELKKCDAEFEVLEHDEIVALHRESPVLLNKKLNKFPGAN